MRVKETRHIIHQYRLEQGALEVQYIEEYFNEFRNKKTAEEIMRRLARREHLILLSMAPSPDEDDDRLIPVAFKVGHELNHRESDPQLMELVAELQGCIEWGGEKIFYSWIGGTRGPWRSQGHYRALTEQQEEWAHRHGYREIVLKTKNKFYSMRATMDHLRFNVIQFRRDLLDDANSKVFLSKKLGSDTLEAHQTRRAVYETA